VTANAPLDQRLVNQIDILRVYELRFRKREGELMVHVPIGQSLTQTLTYPIAASSARNARVRSVTTTSGCTDRGFLLRLEGDAIGLRIDWHDRGPPAWFPVWDSAAFLTFERRTLARLRDFDLIALFADGSERTIGTSSMMLDDRGWVRSPVELLDRYSWPMFAGWFHTDFPREWEPGPHDVDDPRWRGLLALALLLALGYVKPCSWR
jgi:hypothetical protein